MCGDFLNLHGKTFLITGVANKKSIAYFVARALNLLGAKTIFSAQNKDIVQKLFPNDKVFQCDVRNENEIQKLKDNLPMLDGFLHSIAYADFEDGIKPFHETKTEDFLEAAQISCFSLVNFSNYLKDKFNRNASVVTISISNTKITSYGYLGPIKAMLDSTVAYLAKSFSQFSNIRFNSVCSGPLKTSASSGIPNYIENYLFAEQLTLRKEALKTEEVANTVIFLLSEKSSGINAANLLVDAGLSANYFDQDIVSKAMR